MSCIDDEPLDVRDALDACGAGVAAPAGVGAGVVAGPGEVVAGLGGALWACGGSSGAAQAH